LGNAPLITTNLWEILLSFLINGKGEVAEVKKLAQDYASNK
jgi:hypothetical protein